MQLKQEQIAMEEEQTRMAERHAQLQEQLIQHQEEKKDLNSSIQQLVETNSTLQQELAQQKTDLEEGRTSDKQNVSALANTINEMKLQMEQDKEEIARLQACLSSRTTHDENGEGVASINYDTENQKEKEKDVPVIEDDPSANTSRSSSNQISGDTRSSESSEVSSKPELTIEHEPTAELAEQRERVNNLLEIQATLNDSIQNLTVEKETLLNTNSEQKEAILRLEETVSMLKRQLQEHQASASVLSTKYDENIKELLQEKEIQVQNQELELREQQEEIEKLRLQLQLQLQVQLQQLHDYKDTQQQVPRQVATTTENHTDAQMSHLSTVSSRNQKSSDAKSALAHGKTRIIASPAVETPAPASNSLESSKKKSISADPVTNEDSDTIVTNTTIVSDELTIADNSISSDSATAVTATSIPEAPRNLSKGSDARGDVIDKSTSTGIQTAPATPKMSPTQDQVEPGMESGHVEEVHEHQIDIVKNEDKTIQTKGKPDNPNRATNPSQADADTNQAVQNIREHERDATTTSLVTPIVGENSDGCGPSNSNIVPDKSSDVKIREGTDVDHGDEGPKIVEPADGAVAPPSPEVGQQQQQQHASQENEPGLLHLLLENNTPYKQISPLEPDQALVPTRLDKELPKEETLDRPVRAATIHPNPVSLSLNLPIPPSLTKDKEFPQQQHDHIVDVLKSRGPKDQEQLYGWTADDHESYANRFVPHSEHGPSSNSQDTRPRPKTREGSRRKQEKRTVLPSPKLTWPAPITEESKQPSNARVEPVNKAAETREMKFLSETMKTKPRVVLGGGFKSPKLDARTTTGSMSPSIISPQETAQLPSEEKCSTLDAISKKVWMVHFSFNLFASHPPPPLNMKKKIILLKLLPLRPSSHAPLVHTL